MVRSVTETKAGTMTEVKERAKATSEKEVKTPSSESRVSSTDEEPKLYTQKQHEELVHAIMSEQGRKVKEVEVERDSLKAQIQTKETELQDNTEDIKRLEEKLDDLTKDDPDRFNVIKELKAARDERRQLKTRLSTLDDRETKLNEREKRVNSFEREVLIESIADEYKDGDAAKLKRAVSVFENPSEEQVRNIADVLWMKKAAEKEEETPKSPKIYSGKTEGGKDTIGGLPPKERVKEADRRLRV